MTTPPIDYASLAAQARGTMPDYSALAAQARQSAAPDDRSIWQKARDNFNANTQGAKPGDGVIKSFVENFGAGGGDAIRSIGHTLAHPVDAAMDAIENNVSSNPVAAYHAITDAAKSLRDNPARAIGNFGTQAIIGETVGRVAPVVADAAARVPGAAGAGVDAARAALYPKNASIPASDVAAQELVKAMVPDKSAIPNIKSAAPELPDVLASAKAKGTVLNGKLDVAKAAADRASEIQAHYEDAILKPNQGDIQTAPDNYNGETTGKGRATLGQINDRVNDINSELKSNFRKQLASQTTEANASDADLNAEKRGLTDILHNRLAELTGLKPGDIADVRQRAGKLRSLSQEIGASANNDTLAEGRGNSTGSPVSLRNPFESAINKIGGGQEVIGNRIFKNALDNFAPAEKPLPQPAPPAGPTTPEAAQAEFLKAQELEQAAQDQSAGRSQQASSARQSNRGASGSQLWAGQGYAKVLQHVALDTSSGITRPELVKFGLTPEGTRLLINASDLTPGSPAMRSLVNKIKTEIGVAQ